MRARWPRWPARARTPAVGTAPAADLACVHVVGLITDYLDGALPAQDVRRLEAHLADCDGCAVVLEQFRATIDATGRLAEEDVDALDDTTREDLLGAFRRWAGERPPD